MPDINNPLALVEVAIEAKTRADGERLASALAALAAEDPSFRVTTDQESGRIILGGMSELHLDDKLAALKSAHKIDVNVGAPQVAFLERVTRRVEVAYTYKKQRGGSGEFARVKLMVEPNGTGDSFAFESRIVDGAVPQQHIASVRKGVESVLGAGVVAGFPVVDVRVQLIDGAYHEIDSTAPAFEVAARAAFREALQMGRSVLLEPIMDVEVITPDAYARSIIDDLILRRGRIQRRAPRGDILAVNAMAPLMNMFGYAGSLREMTRGRATFTMRFDH